MIASVMRECNNFFDDGAVDGTFSIVGCVLDADVPSGWVAISGSTYHDGVFRIDDGVLDGADMMHDERFCGIVYTLHPPADFIRLCIDIEAYEAKRPAVPLASETFGAYSRSFVTGKAGVVTWQSAFADRLRPYRRMFTGVRV